MTLPEGFIDERVTGVPLPTALAFTPEEPNRMLVTGKPGQLWVHEDGQETPTLALDLEAKVCANSERGLLGVALEQGFGTTNNYVYLYYTYKKHGRCPEKDPGNRRNPVNRVSRFAMDDDTVDPASEQVLIDNIPSPNGNHNAGDLHFGKDGYLYVSVGDGGCTGQNRCQYKNNASRKSHVLLGKILRIEPDGGIPPSNPFTGSKSARCNVTGRTDPGNHCRETFARGFRNPFRMAFDPYETNKPLYYTTFANGGEVRRIVYTGS
jgi:glucose/arabinose dehydrogenase